MRIPLPVNYGAMPGGYINPALISNAQAAYAPMQAQGNALLPLMQAKYMPYQMLTQAMSNPLLWMASQSNPGMMQDMMKNLTQSLPTNNLMGNPASFGTGGGILGTLLGHFGANNQASQAVPSSSAAGNSKAFSLPSEMMPLVQNAGITNAAPLSGQPGWYTGMQNGQQVRFRMQP